MAFSQKFDQTTGINIRTCCAATDGNGWVAPGPQADALGGASLMANTRNERDPPVPL